MTARLRPSLLLISPASALAAAPFVPDGQLFRFGVNFVGSIDEVRLYDRGAQTH